MSAHHASLAVCLGGAFFRARCRTARECSTSRAVRDATADGSRRAAVRSWPLTATRPRSKDSPPSPESLPVAADLEAHPWPFEGEKFDAIVVTHYLHRALFPNLLRALADDGVAAL